MTLNRTLLTTLLLLGTCAAQDVTLQALTDGNFRFKDLGGQALGQNYINTYTYASASVTFSFDVSDNEYLSGTISATGLKPNFAYQIKLAGNPSASATTDAERAAADDATNERLGRLGRWWRAAPSPANSNDADYDINKNNAGYIFEGYLLIGFFVTDASGNASVRFDGNNSFHVLWRVDQRPRASGDGPVLPVTVADTTGNPAYDSALAPRAYSLYGEREPTRATPGDLVMPRAHYRCRLFITEESFHDSGALAGSWTSAMVAPFEFDIPTSSSNPPNDTPPSSVMPLTITRLRSNFSFDRVGRDRAQIQGTFSVPSGYNAANMEVRSSVFNAVENYTLNEKGRDLGSHSVIEIISPKPGQTTAHFRLRLRNADFGITPAVLTKPQLDILTLKIGPDTYAGSVTPKTKIKGQKVALSFVLK